MKINELSYEESITQLEKVLNDLEDDNNTLAQSLENFKKGIKLYKHCSKILSKADGEVKILLGDKENFEEINFLKETEDEY